MTIIELGDYTSGSEQSSPVLPDREFDRRIVRNIALVVVGVLTVLGATGSARPEPRVVRTLWSIPFGNGDQYMVDDDTVYARTVRTGSRFIAYDLADGELLWSMAMPERTGWPTEMDAARVLLVPSGPAETIAVDARTGAELWHRPGTVSAISDDTALLVDQSEDGGVIRGLRMVRARDGGIVWTRPALGEVQMTTGGVDPLDPGYLVTVRPDGAAQVLRWADGVQLAAARIDWRPGAGYDGSFSSLGADARNVYVRLADGRGSSLTAYALDTLARAWRQEDAARVSAYPCGPVICSVENEGFAAYDVVTGVARWRAVGVQDAAPIGVGRMLIAEGASDAYVLVDQLTGDRVAVLGLGTPFADHQGGKLYLLRATRSPAGRTSVSRVDLVTGAVNLRGTISTFADYGCEFASDRAVCPTTARRLVVTAVG